MIRPRFATVLVGLLLVGCQPVVGRLEVEHPIALNVVRYAHGPVCSRGRDSDCGSRVVESGVEYFSPGIYRAELEMDDDSSLRLTLSPSKDSSLVVDLPLPPGTHLPDYQGRFQLPGAKTGQSFDLTGEVSTVLSHSPTYSEWEPCQREVARYFCRHGRKHNCGYYYVTVYGERPVRYHFDYETRNVTLALNHLATGQMLANFDGAQTTTGKTYEQIGFCEYHYPYFGFY